MAKRDPRELSQEPRTLSGSTTPNSYCLDDSAVVGSMMARTSEI
jgi:hypothetical protein